MAVAVSFLISTLSVGLIVFYVMKFAVDMAKDKK